MRETLFILIVIAGLFALTAFRYRRQIRSIYQFWQMAKSIRAANPQMPKAVQPESQPAGKLVNCSKCGTWVPEERSLKIGGTTVFCSAECLERFAKAA